LEAACAANGLESEDGIKGVRATIRSGLNAGLLKPLALALSDLEALPIGVALPPHDPETGECDDTLPAGFIEDDDSPIPEPDELVKGLVPKEGVCFVGGQSQAGKSFIATYLAYCLASAAPFFGRKVRECVGVVVLAAERAGNYRRRMRVACDEVCNGERVPVVYLGDVPNLADDKEIAKLIPRLRQVDRYFRKTYGVRLGAIVIDTVSAAFDLDDEDDNSEAAKTIRRIKTLGQQVCALMLPIHQYGKASTTGLRGASGWKAGCDAILSVLADIDQLTGVVNGNRELALAKSRDGVSGPVAPFELVHKTLGTDSDGEDFGSLYVNPLLEHSSVISTSVKAKRDQPSLAVFRAAFFEMDRVPFKVRGNGPTVQAARLEDVRAEFTKRYPTGEADGRKREDAIRKFFKRAIGYAKTDFSFETQGGVEWVWLTKAPNFKKVD
jgi:AAA domain